MTVVDEFLKHYGIRGQKWGVRRKSRAGHLSKTAFKKKVSEEKKHVNAKPKAHELSDEHLRTAINRMRMEKEYTQLAHGPKPKPQVLKFIGSIGSTVAKTAVTALATQQVNAALKKATSKGD